MEPSSMTEILKGSCLCGAVTYEASGEPAIAGHCHCIDCRKTSGTGHCTHVAIGADGLRLIGEMSCYRRPADSGNVVERFFCPTCGSPIYSTNVAMPGLVFLRASSLDDPDRIKPQMIVYASRAPKWDVMDASLPTFLELPAGGPASVMRD
jgi:hypothetical protein